MKKLLKNLAFTLALLTGTLGFSQVVTLTKVNRVFPEVQLNGPVTFDITYKNTGSEVTGTMGLYIFGVDSGAPLVSTGIQNIVYENTGTGTKQQQVTMTFTSNTTVGNNVDIVPSPQLRSNLTFGRYEIRFFVAGGGFTWAPLAEHFLENPQADQGYGDNNNSGGFMGQELEFQAINLNILNTVDFNSQLASVFVSNGFLNVSEAANYQIIAMTGAIVAEGNASYTIDVSSLSSGVYIYKSDLGIAKFVR